MMCIVLIIEKNKHNVVSTSFVEDIVLVIVFSFHCLFCSIRVRLGNCILLLFHLFIYCIFISYCCEIYANNCDCVMLFLDFPFYTDIELFSFLLVAQHTTLRTFGCVCFVVIKVHWLCRCWYFFNI